MNIVNSIDKESFPIYKERLPENELQKQKQLFSENNLFTELLDSTPAYLAVLNEYRQIVYGNKALRDLLDDDKIEFPFGKRIGEILNCERAFLTSSGCGTTEFCNTCNARKAILSSLKGEEDIQECRIIQKDTLEALDLRVWTKKLEVGNHIFSIFTFVDISHEKRRMSLERIFFHDVLNSAGGIKSYLNLMKDSSKEEIDELLPMMSILSDRLIEEIKSQKDLSFAERDELIVNISKCNPLSILKNIAWAYSKQNISESKEIEIDSPCDEVEFESDELLISRVLGNMLKNSLESSAKNSKIRIGCLLINNRIRFFVSNPGFIPLEIQSQIFQRSFSTKGSGRGLGTYSMKLITERYLKGKVFFKSSEADGTTFYAEYPIN